MNPIKPHEAVIALILGAAATATLLHWLFLIFRAMLGA